jgi:hypothetical protein
VVEVVLPVLASDANQTYDEIAFPPFAGAVQVTLSTPADGVAAVGADGVAGTVVAVTVVAEDAADVPDAFVAITVTEYVLSDFRFVTVIGDVDPVAVLVVSPADVAVTVNEVAAGDPTGRENATDAAPLSNALSVPTSVAVTLTGVCGAKKSFDACDFLPVLFPDAIPVYLP